MSMATPDAGGRGGREWEGTDMGRTLDRGVLTGAGLVAGLLVLNAGLSYRNTRQLDRDAGWVAHTHDVLDATGGVLGDLQGELERKVQERTEQLR
jgi:hypothetical protein